MHTCTELEEGRVGDSLGGKWSHVFAAGTGFQLRANWLPLISTYKNFPQFLMGPTLTQKGTGILRNLVLG
jgi:hypothetical protein